MFTRRLISFILLVSLLAPSFAMPTMAVAAQQGAEGAAVSTLFNCFIQSALGLVIASANFVQIPSVEGGDRGKEACLDSVASLMAKLALAYMTRSIVNWINGGFQGDPTFVSNPSSFFSNIANDVSGEFIKGLGLAGLCDPLKPQIMLALAQLQDAPTFTCTLKDAIKNFDNFKKDFSQGGWAGWFQLTQYPQNNPYGLFAITVDAQNQLVNRALNLKSEELAQGQGFLSLRRCKTWDSDYDKSNPQSYGQTAASNPKGAQKDGGIVGCEQSEVTTPGKMIVEAGVGVNKAPGDQLIAADELNESLAAVFNALIGQLTVQGFKSLSDSKSTNPKNNWFDSANDSLRPFIASLESSVATLQALVYSREASLEIIDVLSNAIPPLLVQCTPYLEANYPDTENALNPAFLRNRLGELIKLRRAYENDKNTYEPLLDELGIMLSQAQEAFDATTENTQAADLNNLYAKFQTLSGSIPPENVAVDAETALADLRDELTGVLDAKAACKADLDAQAAAAAASQQQTQ